jgi:hypothetical protein
VASPIPPPDPPSGIEVHSNYPSLDSLPEYHIHVHKLTQQLDKLDKLNLTLSRFKARVSNVNMNYGNDMNMRQIIESSIIDEAHIVFSTINSAGHPSLESTVNIYVYIYIFIYLYINNYIYIYIYI